MFSAKMQLVMSDRKLNLTWDNGEAKEHVEDSCNGVCVCVCARTPSLCVRPSDSYE